jgi:hypothetical protein
MEVAYIILVATSFNSVFHNFFHFFKMLKNDFLELDAFVYNAERIRAELIQMHRDSAWPNSIFIEEVREYYESTIGPFSKKALQQLMLYAAANNWPGRSDTYRSAVLALRRTGAREHVLRRGIPLSMPMFR